MNYRWLLDVVIAVVVFGGVLYLLHLLPVDATVKKIGRAVILIIAIVFAIKWVLTLG